MSYIPEPSHQPCPMCGKSDDKIDYNEIENLNDQAISNLKFLNLGFILSYHMTDLERKVYYLYQVKRKSFKEIAQILKRKEGTLRSAWNRCKSRGDKALRESQIDKVIIPPYL